jgi:hypothetical protein
MIEPRPAASSCSRMKERSAGSRSNGRAPARTHLGVRARRDMHVLIDPGVVIRTSRSIPTPAPPDRPSRSLHIHRGTIPVPRNRHGGASRAGVTIRHVAPPRHPASHLMRRFSCKSNDTPPGRRGFDRNDCHRSSRSDSECRPDAVTVPKRSAETNVRPGLKVADVVRDPLEFSPMPRSAIPQRHSALRDRFDCLAVCVRMPNRRIGRSRWCGSSACRPSDQRARRPSAGSQRDLQVQNLFLSTGAGSDRARSPGVHGTDGLMDLLASTGSTPLPGRGGSAAPPRCESNRLGRDAERLHAHCSASSRSTSALAGGPA